MQCLNCNPKVKLIEQESDEEGNVFYQFYICPKCKTRHYCTSQSGDMFEEYLNVCDWKEIIMANCNICLNKNKACHICGIGYYWMMYLKPKNEKWGEN